MRKNSLIRGAEWALALLALLVPGIWLRGGDILGTLAVAKPDQALVYVDRVPGTFKGERAKMDQQNKMFTPYVLPVVQGTTVEFHNSDNMQHNVFAVGAEEFNMGNWTKGIVREHTFNHLGEATILCNVHPEMEAYVLVLQNPYFGRPDSSGKFRIANVPPGEYAVKAWYRGKTKQQRVKVPAVGSTSINF